MHMLLAKHATKCPENSSYAKTPLILSDPCLPTQRYTFITLIAGYISWYGQFFITLYMINKQTHVVVL